MNDAEVIEAFLDEGSGAVFGPSLNVERGTLKLDGWWAAAFRVSDRTVIVRDEEAPSESTVLADVAAALTARGLTAVGPDLPAITLLTYTILDLGYAPWVAWSVDRATGEGDLNAKATEESFLGSGSTSAALPDAANTDHARGARRVAGDPTRVVLTVGVGDEWTGPLRDGLADCRFESRAFGEIEAGDCGSLLPTLVLVDATGPTGTAFVVALQGGDSVSAPVVAITANGEMRAGVDATVDADDGPTGWIPLIRDLLV